jgi:hypothetical protein
MRGLPKPFTAVCAITVSCASQAPEPVAPLAGRALLDAMRLELSSNPSGQPYTFVRLAPERFRVQSPVRDLASGAVLEAIARAFQAPSLVSPRAVEPDRLRELGLDPPVGFVEAQYPDGAVRVDLGLPTQEHSDRIWVRRGSELFIGPMALLTSLQFEQEKLRSPRLFAHDLAEIERVKVERRAAGGELRLVVAVERAEDGWRATGQSIDPAALASAAARLERTGLRYGADIERPPAPLQVEVRGKLGTETLSVWQLPDGRLLGRQPERDLEVYLPADHPLFRER